MTALQRFRDAEERIRKAYFVLVSLRVGVNPSVEMARDLERAADNLEQVNKTLAEWHAAQGAKP